MGLILRKITCCSASVLRLEVTLGVFHLFEWSCQLPSDKILILSFIGSKKVRHSRNIMRKSTAWSHNTCIQSICLIPACYGSGRFPMTVLFLLCVDVKFANNVITCLCKFSTTSAGKVLHLEHTVFHRRSSLLRRSAFQMYQRKMLYGYMPCPPRIQLKRLNICSTVLCVF